MKSKKRCAKCKVCKVPISDKNILRNLYENREGLRVKTLIKLTNLKQRTLYKRLNILREEGLLENVFPIWKLINGQVGFCSTLIKSSNIFELHNISYVIKLLKKPVWWNKRKNYLIRLKEFQFKNINFGKGGSNPYQQLINDNFVIQCYPESIIIISKKRYYSNNPYGTITHAMKDVMDILEWFCERFRFNFFVDGIPHIEIRNNDYNRLKDSLAEHCKKQGTKFLVELDKRRKVWVDNSEPFGKEANYPHGQEILEKVTKDLLLKKSFLPSEITQMVGQVTQNQLMFNKNFETHVEVIRTLGKKVEELSEVIKKLKKCQK